MPNIVAMYDSRPIAGQGDRRLQKMIELSPDNEQSYYNLGMQYQKIQKNADAIAAFQKAVEIKPTFDYAWFQIGSCYYGLKNYAKAAEAFQEERRARSRPDLRVDVPGDEPDAAQAVFGGA